MQLNPEQTGVARTKLTSNYCLMCPESHVPLSLPDWPGSEVVYTISPEMGAKFAQFNVRFGEGAGYTSKNNANEFLLFMLSGVVELNYSGGRYELSEDHFAHLQAGDDFTLKCKSKASGDKPAAEMLVFKKKYVPREGASGKVESYAKPLAEVPAEPFLGDEGALLQTLMPSDNDAYDWGVNVFEFVPGGTLPQVEMHFMEHGLYFLQGQGVYRLGQDWHLVQEGDTIWMGPYLEQWYVAAGKTNSKYIYYKEMNREPEL